MKKLSVIITIITISISVYGCKEIQTSNDQVAVDEGGWHQVADGLLFKKITVNNHEHLISKIDPSLFDFRIIENEPPPDNKNIKEIHQKENSLLSFNGIFFTEKYKPTGLLIDNNNTINAYSNAELLNGIFGITKSSKPSMIRSANYQPTSNDYVFALQNGPLLILDKKAQTETDTGRKAARTALGIDDQNQVILVILKQSLLNPDNTLSLYEFTKQFENTELQNLHLTSLLNLDGGVSTGMAIDDEYYPELEKVQNIIIIKPKAKQTSP